MMKDSGSPSKGDDGIDNLLGTEGMGDDYD